MKKDSIWFSILKWGGIFGVLSIINVLLNEDQVNNVKPGFNQIAQLAFYFFSIGFCIWLVHRDYKSMNFNNMGFGKGVGLALRVGLVVGLVNYLFSYIRYSYFNTTYLEQMKTGVVTQLEERGMGSDEIEKVMSISSQFFTPLYSGISNLLGTVFFFLVLGLIVSAITQKEKSIFED
jgi:hypothetical protein